MSTTTASPKVSSLMEGSTNLHGLSFGLVLDRSLYIVSNGSAPVLTATMVLRNETGTSLAFTFITGQEFDLQLRDASGAQVALWSQGRVFPDLVRTVEIAGKETWRATMTLPLSPGAGFSEQDYSATGYLTPSAISLSGPVGGPKLPQPASAHHSHPGPVSPPGGTGSVTAPPRRYSATVGFAVRMLPVLEN